MNTELSEPMCESGRLRRGTRKGWFVLTQPRIPPRPIDDWDQEVHEALSILKHRRVVGTPADVQSKPRPVSGIIGIFAWHPALTRSWLAFSQHLAASTLSDRVREMVIVRTSWLRRGEYEWVQHVKFARAAGLSEEHIQAISEGANAPLWSPPDAAVLRAVDEMCSERYISDPTWRELEKHFDRKQLMDLVFTAGAYDFHAMAFNTFGMEVEPGEGFPGADEAAQPVGNKTI